MNKKLLFLLVGMIVCLSVIGGALAVNYFDADPHKGTIKGDSVIELDLGDSTPMTAITLEEGVEKHYDVVAKVSQSANANSKGNLCIKLSDKESPVVADLITISVYENAAREGDPAYTITGANEIAIDNIATTTTYYLTITLADKADGSYTAAELAQIGGKLTVSFTVAD